MAIVRGEGIVLKRHALGDTSRIVVVYTRDFGMVRLVAKGARASPGRFGFSLEPLSRSRFVFYHKPDRDLQFLSQADTLDPTGSRLDDLGRLSHAQAATELIDRLVWGEEPHADLYDLLASMLAAVLRVPLASLPALTAAFDLQVAGLLGYRPRLDACVGCGSAPSARRWFSPARGGLLCDRCVAGEPGAISLSAAALAGLELLASHPIERAEVFLEVQRTGEIQRVIEAFLTQHFQRFHGLRSLELLRSLPGLDASEDSP